MNIDEKIQTLENIKKLFKEKFSKREYNDLINSSHFKSNWDVINENNNIIKFNWDDVDKYKSYVIKITWDNEFNLCELKLYRNLFDREKYEIIYLQKEIIIELKTYLEKNDFLNYVIEEKNRTMRLDGSNCELEVKINGKYNFESDDNIDNSLIYGFINLLLKLTGIRIEE
jgi:hypothetical protein